MHEHLSMILFIKIRKQVSKKEDVTSGLWHSWLFTNVLSLPTLNPSLKPFFTLTFIEFFQWYLRCRMSFYKTLNPHVGVCWVASVVSNSLWPCRPWPTRLLCPWDSPGKNTGVDGHALNQETESMSHGSPALQVDSLLLSHEGSPLNPYRGVNASQSIDHLRQFWGIIFLE